MEATVTREVVGWYIAAAVANIATVILVLTDRGLQGYLCLILAIICAWEARRLREDDQ
jgi:hypothetical protein